MAVSVIKSMAVWMAAFNLIGFSPALASASQVQSHRNFESMLKPLIAGKALHTYGDFRKAVDAGLTDSTKQESDRTYRRYDQIALPRVKISGNMLFVADRGETISIEFVGTQKTFIKINNNPFSYDDLANHDRLERKLASISGRGSKPGRFALVLDLLFPKAHAINPMLLVGIVGIGFLLFKDKLFGGKKNEDDGKSAEKAYSEGLQKGYDEGYKKGIEQAAGSGGGLE